MKRVLDRLTRLFGFHFGPNAAAEWVTGTLLTRGAGIAAGTNINAGATLTFDVDCAGDDQLDIFINMTGTAAGDLTVIPRPYRGAGNATIIPGMVIPETRHSGPTLSGAGVSFEAQYDVSGYNRVRIDIQNNNVAAQTITEATWRLS